MTEMDKLIEDFKKRLVEVDCNCDEETKSKCLMFPDHCDGNKKEIVDIIELINEGLNNRLLTEKDKQIAKLKEQISILLSCKSCPENKGGYICEKEYNDKCLGQKIEYIKELKEEIAEHKKVIEKMKNSCLDIMRVQGNNLDDDYLAGTYNGMVVIYNSCFLKGDELEKSYCSKNEHGKWELVE